MSEGGKYNPSLCSCCKSKEYSVVARGPRVPIFMCDDCGLMRLGSSKHSARSSWVGYAGTKERLIRQRETKEILQIRDYVSVIDDLDEILGRKGRLLEIGCAMGTLLNEIRQRGWEVTGIEPEEWTCKIARERYGLDVINGIFQDAIIAKSSFDVVLMLHVIEHLADPLGGLIRIGEFLRPSGVLALETPRYDTAMFKFLRGRERSVFEGHTYYFTRHSIQQIAAKAGYEMIKLRSVGRTVSLDRLCFYAAKLLDTRITTRIITLISDSLRLHKAHVHINLHDMMRVYLRKI